MRRPLPPELIALGDHLELATRRELGQRRTRRQLVLNALASAVVAVPLLATAVHATRVPAAPPPPPAAAPARPSFGHTGSDSPPRLLRRSAHPSDGVLYDDTTLRRALR